MTMRPIKAIRRNSNEEELPTEKRNTPNHLYIFKTEAACKKGGIFSKTRKTKTLTKEDHHGRIYTFYI